MTSATSPTVYPFPWTYEQGDPALMLFTAAVARFGLSFRPSSDILELGCAETDWLERMRKIDPTLRLIGVDARPQARDGVFVGDACNPSLFDPESFDAIVLLGALEHFGLGFYGDPIHQDAAGQDIGDVLTMQNVVRWLKPGGHVYFDVPCQPTTGITANRHFRYYSPAAVTERLIVPGIVERARGYSLPEPNAGTWIDEIVERVPYNFVAVLAQKAAD
jgi:SAM-dependent methyltransferase